jgi:PhzF family phenazine biosynthesis protein
MVEVEQWSVFRRGNSGGNPCPVITDASGLRPAQMQAIAAHYGHESVFVTSVDASGVGLRYFVPRHEMRMCVHATIAAVTSLVGAGAVGGTGTVVHTASGAHQVSWTEGSPPPVTVDQHPPTFGPPAAVHREAAAALGLPESSVQPAAPIRLVSVARPKLIVPLRDADAVHGASPDFPALWDLCRQLATTGAYIFAPHPDGDRQHVVARQFPVDAGYPEDPATGVAAAALAAYLADGLRPAQPAWTRIVIDQGDAMGQPSSLLAAALAGPAGTTRTRVTGQAVRTSRDQLDVSAITRGQDLPEPELLLSQNGISQNGLLSRPAKRRRQACPRLTVLSESVPCPLRRPVPHLRAQMARELHRRPNRPCCPIRRFCV